MAYKLLDAAQDRWRRFNGHELLKNPSSELDSPGEHDKVEYRSIEQRVPCWSLDHRRRDCASVKNSRIPASPKAPWVKCSPASGPEQVSIASASTTTVHDATQGVPSTIRSQRSSTASRRPTPAAFLVVEADRAK